MRVGIYCRLSEEDRNKDSQGQDSESIQNQKNMLIRHALNQGWDIYDIYCDDDYTGADRKRPDFQRLLADAEKRRIDIILCKSQGRFTRELEIVEKYIHGLFLEWKIRFIGLVDNADTEVKGNKKSRQINGLMNEWYLEDLSENVRAALESKKRDGKYVANFALYGYKKDEADKNHLIIDDTAATIVRRIYHLFLNGQGQTSIARMLNSEGVLNPTAYKCDLGYKAKGRSKGTTWNLWTLRTVHDILTNQMYVGDLIQGKMRCVSYKSHKLSRVPKDKWIIVPNKHQPIIDRPTWLLVQDALHKSTKMSKPGTINLFAGKIFCANCGSPLHSGRDHNKRYFRCSVHDLAKEKCPGVFIYQEVLEQQVLHEINQLVEKHFDEAMLNDSVHGISYIDKDIVTLRKNLNQARNRADEVSGAMLNMYLDKGKGIIDDETFGTMYARATRESQSILIQIKALESRLDALLLRQSNAKEKIETIREYKHLDSLTRQIVLCFIERIEIGKRDPITKHLPISLRWSL